MSGPPVHVNRPNLHILVSLHAKGWWFCAPGRVHWSPGTSSRCVIRAAETNDEQNQST